VLSIGKLHDPDYYLGMVARGAEEYYLAGKEPPAQWMGRSAVRLGLAGEVDGEALHRVLDHRDPESGTPLTRAQGAPKVPGFDATFCAPKSVSLLFALGDPETSNEARNAHDAAVSAALNVLEDVAARARRGHGGAIRVKAEGFVAAGFRHRTSRAGDPHLHTHVLAANLVVAPHDGRWSALDARPLYGWAKTVGYLYEAQLRADLTRRLGVEWGPVRRGIADIKGIPKQTLRAFSRRRAEIEAHLAERGETTARAAQVATYATRKAKDPDATPEGLLPEWRERANHLGLDDTALAGLLGRAHPAHRLEPGTEAAERLFAALAAPDGLTARASTFGRREVLQAICDRLPCGGDIADILTLTDVFLASEHVVCIGVPERLRSTDVLRVGGSVVPTHTDEVRWTTPELLATEERLVMDALGRVDEQTGVVPDGTADAVLAAHPTISSEQAAMVRRLTMSGAGVDVVVGVAGSGKTYALGAARQAWVAAGYRVIGATLSARAASELQDGSGIPATTLARLLTDLDRPEMGGFAPRTVLVVDEGAMVGTRQLARLLQHAQAAGAKVVLTGDHHQLPEIDAGGAFAALAVRLDAVSLSENRRQIEAWERDALAELRHGDPDVALAAYHAHDRIHHADTSEHIRERLVADWWTARQAGGRHLMVASRHVDVDDLNQRARQRLRHAGQLGEDLVIGQRRFAVGDEVLATRNDYRLGVLNGTRATITSLDAHARRIDVVHANGQPRAIPFAYAEAGHLTHGYATTLHKTQGATLEQTFVLADDTLHRERSYSGLSRGVERNDLYLAGIDHDDEHHGHQEDDDLLERLRWTASRSDAKTLALDDLLSGRAPQAAPGIDELWAERLRLAPIVNRAPRPPFDELRALERDLQRATANLADGRRERQAAEEALEGFRGYRRIARRDDRRQAETRLHRAKGLEAGAEEVLANLGKRRDGLEEQLAEWKEWNRDHGHEAERLRQVDSLIRDHHQQRQPTLGREQGKSASVVRDVGIDLGR
jgi:conjugative relaxase-like TrwC/TraI family protein